jgi:hypothetical protein
MSGNSDHPPAFHSGDPENFAGISVRGFNDVEHLGIGVVGEERMEGISTGVFWGVADSKRKSREPVQHKNAAARTSVSLPRF